MACFLKTGFSCFAYTDLLKYLPVRQICEDGYGDSADS